MSAKAPFTTKRKPPASAWKPGQSGNPSGRKLGSRNKATLVAQALIDGQGEQIVSTAVDLALAGDVPMLRTLIERLVPPRKDGPVKIDLPPIMDPAGCVKATTAVVEAVANGELTPSEGQAVAGLVEVHRKSLEMQEIELRVQALENRVGGDR